MKKRLLPLTIAVVLGVSVVTSACSSSSSSDSRNAAGTSAVNTDGFSRPTGDPATAINANNWCLRPQDVDGDSGFRWVRNITVCQVMTNMTKQFTAPGVLSDVATLGVVRADCSQNDATCSNVGGDYMGEVRTEGVNASNVTLKGDRYANPNPFLVKSAIQFMPRAIWSGVNVRTYVGANSAPFDLGQAQAEMFSYIPTNGSNSASCTSGQFISCVLVTPEANYKTGSNLQFEYRFSNRPVSIQITNGTKQQMTIVGSTTGTAGSAFLLDPKAAQGLASIAPGASGYTGGYAGTSGDTSRYWRASYCISLPDNSCYQVNISISLTEKDGQLVGDSSSCDVVKTSQTYSFRCDKPTLTGGEDGRFFTVNITG